MFYPCTQVRKFVTTDEAKTTTRTPKHIKHKQYKETFLRKQNYESLPNDELIKIIYKKVDKLQTKNNENKQLKQRNTSLNHELTLISLKLFESEKRERYFETAYCNVQTETEIYTNPNSDDNEYVDFDYTPHNKSQNKLAYAEDIMYILALRQYCHALNIPKVLNIAATFFSHKGYDLSDYSLCIPSPAK